MVTAKFETRVKENPDKIAIKTGEQLFTYRELHRYANRIANGLREKWPAHSRHPRVGLLFRDAFHMTAAILGALKVGKAYVPLSTDYPWERLSYIIAHSEVPVILTDGDKREVAGKLKPHHQALILETEEMRTFSPTPGIEENNEPKDESIMYILYTSGSTGTPRGVMQTRCSVLYYIDRYTEQLSITGNDHMTLFSSFSHDAAVMDLYGALLNGATLYPLNIMELADLSLLSQWLVKERITIWHSVPTLYRYFVRILSNRETYLNLRFIVLGGEPVIPYDIDMFNQLPLAPDTMLYNLYGQTESTYNSGMFIPRATPIKRITLGQAVKGTAVYVVNDQGHEVNPFEIGEIIVGSPYVSPGYWKDEETSKKSFQEDEENCRLYRTGDFGCLLLDGTIEFIGRKDTQVKIRGYRIELGEIESQLLRTEGIKEALVIDFEDNSGQKYLCGYIVSGTKINLPNIKRTLAGKLPDYMIPAHLVEIPGIPLLPNGKVNRKALPLPGVITGEQYRAPTNDIQKKLVGIWVEILHLDKSKIGIDFNFFDLGGHSLRAAVMVSKIHKELDVSVPLAEIFKTPTIKQLARYIKDAGKTRYAAIEAGEKKDFYPLSSPQERLYILQQSDEGNTAYNMTSMVVLEGEMNRDRLEDIFCRLIKRHESLRTSFQVLAGQLVQRSHALVDFAVEYYDLQRNPGTTDSTPLPAHQGQPALTRLKENFTRPFNLAKAPLLRVVLIKQQEKKHILMLDMHHIISDATSRQILVEDFVRLYQGTNLDPLTIQYKDYALWQHQLLNKQKLQTQEKYWLKKLHGFVFTKFPLDRFDSYNRVEGKREFLKIDTIYDKIEQFCNQHKITKFVFMITVFQIILAREIEQEDITIGIPVSIRDHPDLKSIIGIFLNVLLIRTKVNEENTFLEHLEKSKQTVIEALDNKDYPYERLDYKIREAGGFKNNELFSILFNYLPMQKNEEAPPNNLGARSLNIEDVTPKYDITLYVQEAKENMALGLVYKSNIYDQYTMQSLLESMLKVIQLVLKNEDITISGLILPGEEDYDGLDTEYEKYDNAQ